METVYHSVPLSHNRRTIRLLHVHSDRDLSKAVSCDLSVIDLDGDHPPFAALSYVWNIDTEPKREVIQCGGQAISLTRNGHDALRHLRDRLGSFTIWIDAICIDQTNHEEKMNQVRFMGSIYSKASIVYIWLGIGGDSSQRGLGFFEHAGFQHYFRWDLESASIEDRRLEIQKAARAYAFGRLGRIKESSSSVHHHGLTAIYSHTPNRVALEDLVAFLDNTWLARMWTYQEILLASSPTIVLGNNHLQWSTLDRGIVFLRYSGVCGRLQPRLNKVLQAWTELVLTRDRLLAVPVDPNDHSSIRPRFPSPGEGLQQTSLLQYRDSIIDVAEVVNRIRRACIGFAWKICVVVGLTCMVDWLGAVIDFGTSGLPVNESLQALLVASNKTIGSLTACLQACQNITAPNCIYTCKGADFGLSKLGLASENLKSASGHWHRDIWLIALPVIISVLGLISLSLACFAKYLGKRAAGPVYPNDTTLDLVKDLCTRNCTEVKDKALAVHAILQRISTFELKLPDTTLPVCDIFAELARNIIEATGSLALFIPAAAYHFENSPSWVPNWSAAMDPLWISQPLYLGHPADATPGSQGVFSWDIQNKSVITVSGVFRYGKVFRIYQLLETSDTYQPHESIKHLTNLRMMVRFLQHITEPKPKDINDNLAMLIGSGPVDLGTRHITEIFAMLSETDNYNLEMFNFEDFKQWANCLLNFELRDSVLLLSLLTQRNMKDRMAVCRRHGAEQISYARILFQCLNKCRTPFAKIWQTHIAVCNALTRSRKVLFRTALPLYANRCGGDPRQRAHYRKRGVDAEGPLLYNHKWLDASHVNIDFGMASDAIKPGDNLALISGVRIPLILRVTSDTSKLVSPAIVPQLMTGRGWDDSLNVGDLIKIHLS